jgi:hypothetical protein
MTGYLDRLVARHAREPAVHLRAPSRFEGDLVGGLVDLGGAAAVPIEAGPGAPTATGDLRGVPPGVPRDHRDHAAAADAHASRDDRAGRRSRAAVVAQRDDASSTGVPAQATPPPSASSSGRRERPGPIEPHDKLLATEPIRVRGVLRRQLERQEAATVASGRRLAASTRLAEPDVVQVHIGRVEVRAVVAPSEPARPATRPATPKPLSLDRYLSGERAR